MAEQADRCCPDARTTGGLKVRGDFRRAVITANTIECGTYRCGFGIQLDPHSWYVAVAVILPKGALTPRK